MTTLAYFLHDLSPFIVEFRSGIGVRWYGFAYVLAFIVGYWLYKQLARRGYCALPSERVADFITWGAIFGVMVGGRLGHIFLYDLHEFLHNPLIVFRVWEGGMSSHGGMIGLILFTLYYAQRHNVSWLSIGDNLCVVAPIGLFFGRIANFINGELYGRETTVPWAVQFPTELWESRRLASHAVAAAEKIVPSINTAAAVVAHSSDPHLQEILRGILPPRHPSQIYEALLEGVVLFCALWFLRTRTRQPRGVLTGAFFILYGVLRIIGEMFREPEVHYVWLGPLTYGQFLSLFVILIGAAFVAYALKHPQYEAAQKSA